MGGLVMARSADGVGVVNASALMLMSVREAGASVDRTPESI
jgi:hypothetical protein